MVCMIALFQNMVALSLQIGILIGIVLLFSRVMKKPYQIVGRYCLWLVLALRLLVPVNMGWFQVEDVLDLKDTFLSGKEVQQSADSGNAVVGQKVKSVPTEQRKDHTDDGKMFTEQRNISDNTSTELQKEAGTEVNVLPNEDIAGKANIMIKCQNWYYGQKNTFWNVLFIVWLTGLLIMAGYEVLRYQSVYKSIRRWLRSVPGEYVQELNRVKQEMHICKDIPVYQCSKVFSPMIVGLRKPSIILPEKSYKKDSLYFIYKHELTHYCHGDLYYKCIQTITKCVYWFQPMVHMMYQQAAFDVELLCDERVTKNESLEFCQAYSFVLLDTLTEQNTKPFPLSTCFMNGGKKQMKERFLRIMSQNKAKYGIAFFGILIACALVLGNVSLHPSNAEKVDVKRSSVSEVTPKKPTGIKHILVVGEENITDGQYSRADLNILVTVNTQSKTVYVTDLHRDMLVNYHGEKSKLSGLYAVHGMEASKEVVEDMAGISIDSTVKVNFQQFENVVDAIGGLEINLTKKEAGYLNKTNYIRDKKYRNVKEGVQKLNGQQVLGYARIRKVKSASGKQDSFGRGERGMTILSAMQKAVKKLDAGQWKDTVKTLYDCVTVSGLELSDVYGMVDAVLSDGYTCVAQQVPDMIKKKDGSWVSDFEPVQEDTVGICIQYDFSQSESLAKIAEPTITAAPAEEAEANWVKKEIPLK